MTQWSKIKKEYRSRQQVARLQPQPIPKHRNLPAMKDLGGNVNGVALDNNFISERTSPAKHPTSATGTKIAKEEQQLQEKKDYAIRAQA